jgi:hypothetical protein
MVALSRLLLVVLLAPLCAVAQSERSAEIQIKAAFLYKFGEFVQWPEASFAHPDGPFAIGIMNADELASSLEQLVVNRTVHGRPVAVRRLRRGESPAGLHILFIGQSESARLGDILATARGHAVLTVTESENAIVSGSMINFVAEERKVRFDVALPPAERGQLKISARLLAVARKVMTS